MRTCLRVLKGHSSRVCTLAFDANQKLLATGSLDQTIRIWDVESGECLKVLEEHTNRVQSVTFLSKTRTLVSGSYDETIKIWDIDSGTCTKTLINKPYAGMNIKKVRGLTKEEKENLILLGAVEK